MRHLYFIRHGQTEWNAIMRMQGQWNSDLNDLGREQADVNGLFLKSQNIEKLYVSPLDRTKQTAEIINRHLNVPVRYDDRIMEWDTGDWSGHLYADVKLKWAKEWQAFEADRFNYRGPNCENYPDMIARSTPFLNELIDDSASNIGIVSHGLIGRVMISTLLAFNEHETLAFHQGNDVIYRVTLEDESRSVEHFVRGKGPLSGLVT